MTPTMREFFAYFDALIPSELSCSWDHDGLMCLTDPDKPIKKVVLTLDATLDAINFAVRIGADAILSHHPMIFRPIGAVEAGKPMGDKLVTLVRSGIGVFSFHTRLDSLDGGVNDCLLAALDLTPDGKFAEKEGEVPMGRIGLLDGEMCTADFAAYVKEKLGCDRVNFVDAGKPVGRVAMVGGGGKGFLAAAKAAGADCYLTGEMSYDTMIDAAEMGLSVIEAGHFYTEEPVLRFYEERLAGQFPTVEAVRYRSNPIKAL